MLSTLLKNASKFGNFRENLIEFQGVLFSLYHAGTVRLSSVKNEEAASSWDNIQNVVVVEAADVVSQAVN